MTGVAGSLAGSGVALGGLAAPWGVSAPEASVSASGVASVAAVSVAGVVVAGVAGLAGSVGLAGLVVAAGSDTGSGIAPGLLTGVVVVVVAGSTGGGGVPLPDPLGCFFRRSASSRSAANSAFVFRSPEKPWVVCWMGPPEASETDFR